MELIYPARIPVGNAALSKVAPDLSLNGENPGKHHKPRIPAGTMPMLELLPGISHAFKEGMEGGRQEKGIFPLSWHSPTGIPISLPDPIPTGNPPSLSQPGILPIFAIPEITTRWAREALTQSPTSPSRKSGSRQEFSPPSARWDLILHP